MRTAIITTLAFTALAAAAPLACDEGSTDEAELRVVVNVPAELPLEDATTATQVSVVLAIKGVGLLHAEQGWIEVEVPAKIDLTQPETLPRLLEGVKVPWGRYEAVRFYDTAAWVVVNGKTFPLDIAGDQGFYLITSFCIEDAVEHLELDWDIEGNLHYDTARGWWLSPKLVVRSAPVCGDQCK